MANLDHYFADLAHVIQSFLSDSTHHSSFQNTLEWLALQRDTSHVVWLIGNGGSAAVAEHMAEDFTKCGGVRANTFSSVPMLTCFANDYGFQQIYSRCVDFYAQPHDTLIAISSSGCSANILNACDAAAGKGMKVITLSGFDATNPLRSKGAENFWVDSRSYGYVELVHNLVLHSLSDELMNTR